MGSNVTFWSLICWSVHTQLHHIHLPSSGDSSTAFMFLRCFSLFACRPPVYITGVFFILSWFIWFLRSWTNSCYSCSNAFLLFRMAANAAGDCPFFILKSAPMPPPSLLEDCGRCDAFMCAHWGHMFSNGFLSLFSGICGLTPARISCIYRSFVRF